MRLGNQHDAEDLTSQIFIETLIGLRQNRYKENGCFPAWLFTIVRRRLVDFQRQRVSLPLDEHPSTDPDLLDVIQASENVERLSHLLSQMDNEKQELLRLRFAAKLQRETGKPILTTGGAPLGNNTSEAEQMKTVLEQDFSVPVRWTESASDNTLENARLSRQMLKQAGIDRIYLVTHAWHMPRAVQAFQTAGFRIIPAPTAYTTRYRTDLLAFVPNAYALHNSRIFMHELIGMLWYQLKS